MIKRRGALVLALSGLLAGGAAEPSRPTTDYDATVRFDVTLREVTPAGLQMSSPLIKLAQRVITDGT